MTFVGSETMCRIGAMGLVQLGRGEVKRRSTWRTKQD